MAETKTLVNADTKALLDAVGHIYEAALDDEGWEPALHAINTAMGAPCSTIGVIDAENANLNFYRGVEYDPAFIASYDAYYLSINPFRQLLQTCGERVTLGLELVEESGYRRTEYYNDWARPQKLDYDAGYVFNHDGTRFTLLTSTRPRRMGQFGEAELVVLRTLAPHIKRALALRRRLWDVAGERDAFTEALDGLAFGVVLVDESGHVRHANQRARTLFQDGEGLRLHGRQLCTPQAAETEILRRLIHDAVQASLGLGGGAGSMALPRASHLRPLLVQVYPLRAAAGDALTTASGKARALVAVHDPDDVPPAPAALLRQAFGLTPAETRLVVALAQGTRLSEAAEMLSLSKETVRNQLKSVFAKTDTHRQSDLVRLVTALAPVSRGPSRPSPDLDPLPQ